MSSFYCEKCGALIADTPGGYVTECEHYPRDPVKLRELWEKEREEFYARYIPQSRSQESGE